MSHSSIGTIAFVIWLALLGCYLIPTIVAYNRKARNAGAMFIVNLLLGWTLIGWAWCIYQALTAESVSDYKNRTDFYRRNSDQA